MVFELITIQQVKISDNYRRWPVFIWLVSRDNFITGDAMDTASQFICKDGLQAKYDTIERPSWKGKGSGGWLRIDLLKQ